jgi:predicted transcriptional regulator
MIQSLLSQPNESDEANLTHLRAVKYLRKLVELGLLFLTDFKPYSYYEITKKVVGVCSYSAN